MTTTSDTVGTELGSAGRAAESVRHPVIVRLRKLKALLPSLAKQQRRTVGLATAGVALGVVAWVDPDRAMWARLGHWAVNHVALFGAVILATMAVASARRASPTNARGKSAPSTLPLWLMGIAAAIVAGAVWVATDWLLGEAVRAKDPAAARIEAIKTGLTVGAGCAGIFALLLALRRQWHQEVTSHDIAHDATERRITELYTKAAEQLGSEHATVRHAGLYALERLGQDNPGQRETIGNVLCAYLRMPHNFPDEHPGPDATDDERKDFDRLTQEQQPRLTAQRILYRHLLPELPDEWWPELVIDLAGANLTGADLSYADLSSADLRHANLTRANLCGAHLADVDLTGADLTKANLTRANLRFTELTDANLTDADFAHADLSKAIGLSFSAPPG